MPSSSATPNSSTITLLNANAANHILALRISSVTGKKPLNSYIRIIINTWELMRLPEKIISPNIFETTIVSTTWETKMIPPSRSSAISLIIPIFLRSRINTLTIFIIFTTILSFHALYKLM